MKLTLNILALLTIGSLVGCQSGPNAQRGAAVGGVAGAAVGGIIGHQSGRGLEGAAIGAAGGAATGGLLGSAQDKENEQARHQPQASPYGYSP